MVKDNIINKTISNFKSVDMGMIFILVFIIFCIMLKIGPKYLLGKYYKEQVKINTSPPPSQSASLSPFPTIMKSLKEGIVNNEKVLIEIDENIENSKENNTKENNETKEQNNVLNKLDIDLSQYYKEVVPCNGYISNFFKITDY